MRLGLQPWEDQLRPPPHGPLSQWHGVEREAYPSRRSKSFWLYFRATSKNPALRVHAQAKSSCSGWFFPASAACELPLQGNFSIRLRAPLLRAASRHLIQIRAVLGRQSAVDLRVLATLEVRGDCIANHSIDTRGLVLDLSLVGLLLLLRLPIVRVDATRGGACMRTEDQAAFRYFCTNMGGLERQAGHRLWH